MTTTNLVDASTRPLRFRRHSDTKAYRFFPGAPRNGRPTWKRIDLDVYVVFVPDFGWACVDAADRVLAEPDANTTERHGTLPPKGQWHSTKDGKSFAYDLIWD